MQNIFTGHRIMKSDETGVESKLVWKPTSSTKVTLAFLYDYINRDYFAEAVYPGTVAADGTTNLGPWRTSSRIDPRAPIYSYQGSLKVEQDLGFANFKSLFAYQTSHQEALFSPAPGPGQPLPGQGSPINDSFSRNRTYSEEVTLTSKPSSSRFDWIVGAFYFRDRSALRLFSSTTCVTGAVPPCAPGTPVDVVGYPTTNSYSAYADANYRFFKATHLTIGLRYTDEDKGLSGSEVPLPGLPDSIAAFPPAPTTIAFYPGQPFLAGGVLQPGIPTQLNFKKLTYRFVLAQDINDDLHVYVSDNLGFKSGAYNANVFSNPPALPETLYAYEVGAKSELFDRRVRLNLAGFYYNYDNVQVRTMQGAPAGNTFLLNAASERQYGLDGDFNVIVTHGLSINGGFEVLHSRYVNFPGSTCAAPGTKVVNGIVVGASVTSATAACGTPGVVASPYNLAGYTTPQSPAFSGSIGFIYKVDSAYGAWALSANDHFYTANPLVADGSLVNNAHDLVDASLTWTLPNKHFDIELYGRNLLNQLVYTSGFTATPAAPSYYVTMGLPRTYGVTVGYHF